MNKIILDLLCRVVKNLISRVDKLEKEVKDIPKPNIKFMTQEEHRKAHSHKYQPKNPPPDCDSNIKTKGMGPRVCNVTRNPHKLSNNTEEEYWVSDCGTRIIKKVSGSYFISEDSGKTYRMMLANNSYEYLFRNYPTDLKCCGNCENSYLLPYGAMSCSVDGNTRAMDPRKVCKKWEDDTFRYEGRLVGH